MQRSPHNGCDNLNHRRSNAPVRHCPQCGGIVNDAIQTHVCTDTEHASLLKQRAFFCAHCGRRLKS